MCRQVSKALADHRYYELPWWRRIPMFIHIRLCVMCGKSNQQIVDIQKGVHEFLDHEDADDIKHDVHLSSDARHRIESALKQE
jgi:alkylated DNA nucleotide flippase Atl1